METWPFLTSWSVKHVSFRACSVSSVQFSFCSVSVQFLKKLSNDYKTVYYDPNNIFLKENITKVDCMPQEIKDIDEKCHFCLKMSSLPKGDFLICIGIPSFALGFTFGEDNVFH